MDRLRREEIEEMRCYLSGVDRLRREEIEEMRRTPPEEKARQAFELMRSGIALKRVSLRLRNPDASEAEIDALLDAWLAE